MCFRDPMLVRKNYGQDGASQGTVTWVTRRDLDRSVNCAGHVGTKGYRAVSDLTTFRDPTRVRQHSVSSSEPYETADALCGAYATL